jgi:hypothetical protein
VRRAASARGRARLAYVDAAVDLAVPPFSVVVAVTTAWAGLSLFRAAARRRFGLTGAAALGVMAAQSGYVLSALRMVGAGPAVYRSLLGAPRVVVWKLGLWGRQLVGREDVAWVRTARNVDGASPAEETGGASPDVSAEVR